MDFVAEFARIWTFSSRLQNLAISATPKRVNSSLENPERRYLVGQPASGETRVERLVSDRHIWESGHGMSRNSASPNPSSK
jgi:hypothetical protein